MLSPLLPYFGYNNVGFFATYSNAINGNDVFVLGNNGALWRVPPPFHPGNPIPNPARVLIDQNVRAFQISPGINAQSDAWRKYAPLEVQAKCEQNFTTVHQATSRINTLDARRPGDLRLAASC